MSFFRTLNNNNHNTKVNETPVEGKDGHENLVGHLNPKDLCEIIHTNDLHLQSQGIETPSAFPLYDFSVSESMDAIYLSYLQTTPSNNFEDEAPAESEDNLDNIRTIECVVTNSSSAVTQPTQHTVPDSGAKMSPFTTKRLCLNTPTTSSLAKTSKALVSKDDGVALTEVEIKNLKKLNGAPFTREEIENLEKLKIKKFFVKNEVLTEAVTNNNWWYEHIWVHAKPENGYMVYVDPEDYPNLKKVGGSKYCYGEPPIEVIRYGNYRKQYNENNELIVKPKRGEGNNKNVGAKRTKRTETTEPVHNNQSQVMRFSLFNHNRVTATNYQYNATRGPEAPNPDGWF